MAERTAATRSAPLIRVRREASSSLGCRMRTVRSPLSLVGIANVSCVLGRIDRASAAGGWPLVLGPGAELLWRAANAEPDGSGAGSPVARVVMAVGCPAATESGRRIA